MLFPLLFAKSYLLVCFLSWIMFRCKHVRFKPLTKLAVAAIIGLICFVFGALYFFLYQIPYCKY